ncbi:hypothetical protein SEVIR_5G294250v4 [Setaria viridis]
MGLPFFSLLIPILFSLFDLCPVSYFQVIMNFVYLGSATGLASTFQVSCWTITGERQAARIRVLYLNAILRQDIAFFDMDMSTGKVVERMAGDTFLIQDAIGEKPLIGSVMEKLSQFCHVPVCFMSKSEKLTFIHVVFLSSFL